MSRLRTCTAVQSLTVWKIRPYALRKLLSGRLPYDEECFVTEPQEPRPEEAESENAAASSSPVEPESESAETSAASDNSEDPADAEGADDDRESDEEATNSEGADNDSSSDEELPEWEPLTPEDVEDEAIRGDFMLRWAVVLLAFLLGCREIGETMTLVRVRTGEAISSNGFWPPGTDPFSYSAGDQSWVNPAWMFDLILAGVWNIGGGTGLSLLTALLAGATFYLLVHIRRAELPTWWTAVCAAIALLMVQAQFTALPELVTLLGTVWLLRGLVHWSQSGDSRTLWCLIVSLAVWSNLDQRAFIGWLILAAFAAGTWLSRKGRDVPGSMQDLGKAVGFGLIALMINPAGWHAILSPIQIYGVENPALLTYAGAIDSPAEARLLSLFDPRFADVLDVATIAGLVLVGIGLLSCVANLQRLDWGLTAAFVVTVALAAICSHELAAASLVACALAALNGQDWYRDRCRQEYTTETLEVLWSRAGRALTVLALACFAWLATSGRMMGVDGRRVGLGFASWLQAAMDGTGEDLADVPDERLFVMRLEHGDLLVWHSRPTFIDSRVGLYGEDILKLHDQARFAMRSRRDRSNEPDIASQSTSLAKERESWSGKPELWKDVFKKYDIGLVTPRLWGASPDYVSLLDLLDSGEWTLTSLGSTLAALAPRGADMAAEDHRIDLVGAAFRDCRLAESDNQRVEFPQARTGYQQFLSLPSRNWSPVALRARHEQALASAGFSGLTALTKGEVIALASLALRDAASGTIETPDNSAVYRTAAEAHSALRLLENQVMGGDAGIVATQRYFQRVHFLRQALTLAPDDPGILSALAQEYYSAQRLDLTLETIDRFLDAVAAEGRPGNESLTLVRQLQTVRAGLLQQSDQLEKQLEPVLTQDGVDVVQVAGQLQSQGFPLRALQLLDDNKLTLSGNMAGQIEYGILLMECGRLVDATGVVSTFDSFPETPGVPLLWTLHAAWLDQARGDHSSAIIRCERKRRQIELGSAQALLAVAPFVQPLPQLTGDGNTWPVSETAISGRVFAARDEAAILRWTIASAYLESGDCGKAAETLQTLLETEPENVLRPLAAMYLELLTGESIPHDPPSERTPILFVDGPEDPEPPEPAEASVPAES